jgi:hypothetical protein
MGVLDWFFRGKKEITFFLWKGKNGFWEPSTNKKLHMESILIDYNKVIIHFFLPSLQSMFLKCFDKFKVIQQTKTIKFFLMPRSIRALTKFYHLSTLWIKSMTRTWRSTVAKYSTYDYFVGKRNYTLNFPCVVDVSFSY